MIVVVGFLFSVAMVPILGGRMSRLALVSFDKGWLIALAMFIQVPITTFAAGWFAESVTSVIHLITYGFAFAFVWFNRSHVGMIILALGALANFAAIAANGGVMPASEWATETAGREDTGEFMNSAVLENARLQFLGDIFAIPSGWPFANVFSIGDLLLVLGGGFMLHRLCGSILFPKIRQEMIVAEFWDRFENEATDTGRMIEVVEAASLQSVGSDAIPGRRH